jgi:hypothetical protein
MEAEAYNPTVWLESPYKGDEAEMAMNVRYATLISSYAYARGLVPLSPINGYAMLPDHPLLTVTQASNKDAQRLSIRYRPGLSPAWRDFTPFKMAAGAVWFCVDLGAPSQGMLKIKKELEEKGKEVCEVRFAERLILDLQHMIGQGHSVLEDTLLLNHLLSFEHNQHFDLSS